MTSIQAARLTGLHNLAVSDIPSPTLERDTDVFIKMARVGICGSDVHYYTEGAIGSQIVQYPWTIGHEGAGVVERVGAGVTRVKPGDRVAIDPAMPCWKCDQCLAGRSHTCRNLKFLGCPGQAEGLLCDSIVMPETSCFPIPPHMTFDEAAIVEPLSIGVYAVHLSIPMAGAAVGILGAGPIGLSVLLPARAMGARRIYITDKIDARLDIASRAGADWVGNPDTSDVVEGVSRCEPGLLDVVFECTGEQDAIDQGVDLLKPGGKLMLIGIPGAKNRISFEINQLRRKEICIQNVRRQNECVERAIGLIAEKAFDVNVMVTHHLPMSSAKDGFDMVAGYQDGVVKAMIVLGDEAA